MQRITVNLRHLAKKDLHLDGEASSSELELDNLDEMIRVSGPVQYDLEAQKIEQSLLVQGTLRVALECNCVRCLKAFPMALELTGFAAEFPLTGPDAEVEGDFVDLTPTIREDILLAFPQHPLCDPECAGMKEQPGAGNEIQSEKQSQMTSSVWEVLNELKL